MLTKTTHKTITVAVITYPHKVLPDRGWNTHHQIHVESLPENYHTHLLIG